MIWQRLRKLFNSRVVTISLEETERQNLEEGQLLTFEAHPAETRPSMSLELYKAFEESWHRNESGYRYLAEH
jgi:hypothetical protein